jgi:predicted deacylase
VAVENTDYFSSDYHSARQKFLDAVAAAGGAVQSFRNPHAGPDGEALFTDVSLFGSGDAPSILVLGSATHGVEGFAGSAIQTGLLIEGIASRLPSGVSLLVIHAINPYGMAHLRRFTEDNVDLNRNFRDHSQPHSPNPGYENLATAIAPTSLSFWSEVISWSRLPLYVLTHGFSAGKVAVSGGQYSHPDGLFYGGTFETWSNKTIRSIAEQYLSHANRVVFVDFHTGLGAYGAAEVILNVPHESPDHRRAVSIWGPDRVRATGGGESVSIHLDASVKIGISQMLPNAEVTAVSLEFGTVPILQVMKALRAENWLHHHGGPGHPKAQEIKTCLLRTFHPDDEAWEAAVWKQGKEVVDQALVWLGRAGSSESNSTDSVT